MGGHAFRSLGFPEVRLSAKEYLPFSEKVVEQLSTAFPGCSFLVPKSYSSKESFGDLDIVTDLPKDSRKEAEGLLRPQAVNINGPCMSLLVDDFQVDLISLPKEDLVTSFWYYSYNDIGNLLGKIFHKFGIKYGHRGLTLPLRSGTHKFGEVMISKDLGKILSSIGLSAERYKKGFLDLEDMFQFVESSPFFNPAIYQYSALNAENRVRDRKRPTYQAFIQRWEGRLEGGWYEFKENKEEYLEVIFLAFPLAKEEYLLAKKALEEDGERKLKFNGELVLKWTGLCGHKLGEFMREFREKYSKEWFSGKDVKEIEQMVKSEFKK